MVHFYFRLNDYLRVLQQFCSYCIAGMVWSVVPSISSVCVGICVCVLIDKAFTFLHNFALANYDHGNGMRTFSDVAFYGSGCLPLMHLIVDETKS